MLSENLKVTAYGAEIEITKGGAVYVTINGTTVYYENSEAGRILNAWNAADMEEFKFPEFSLD